MKGKSKIIDFFWILLGNFSALIVTIVSAAVLSRYFDKHDYGTYKQVMYVYSMLSVVFSLGVPKAYSYFLPRVDIIFAKSIITKINNLLLIMGCFLSCFLFFGNEILAEVLGNSDLAVPLKYFALNPLFMLPTLGVESILVVYGKSGLIAANSVLVRVISLIGVLVPVLYFNGGVNEAMVGLTVSSFIGFVIGMVLKNYPVWKIRPKSSPLTYRKIIGYIWPIMIAGVWGIVIGGSDLYFVSKYFGAEVFALYSNGSLEIPLIGMIISSGSLILFPLYSRYSSINDSASRVEIVRLWRSVFTRTALLTYPIVVFCVFFADEIMIALYGHNYQDSGQYFRIKALSNFFTLVAYGPLILSIGGEKYYRNVHMFLAFFIVFGDYVMAVVLESSLGLVIISSFGIVLKVFFMLRYISRFFNISIYELLPRMVMLKVLSASTIIGSVVKVLSDHFLLSDLSSLVWLFLVFFSLYFILSWFFKLKYYQQLEFVFKSLKI